MMYAMVVRRLKPGAYEHFRRAWEPDSPEHRPAGADQDLDRAQR